jgi:ABC-type branched-subunit amino acid transport system permease subunit
MKRQTFLILGVASLLIVISGFLAVFLKQGLLSLMLIALGFIVFTLILRKAKKEDWFGKPVR